MLTKRSVLVIYDVEETKVRNKVVKEIESYGVRVQKSAFECYLDDSGLNKLIDRIRRIIGEDDSIRVYNPGGMCYDLVADKYVELYSPKTVIV